MADNFLKYYTKEQCSPNLHTFLKSAPPLEAVDDRTLLLFMEEQPPTNSSQDLKSRPADLKLVNCISKLEGPKCELQGSLRRMHAVRSVKGADGQTSKVCSGNDQ
jgi:hypothetical protein